MMILMNDTSGSYGDGGHGIGTALHGVHRTKRRAPSSRQLTPRTERHTRSKTDFSHRRPRRKHSQTMAIDKNDARENRQRLVPRARRFKETRGKLASSVKVKTVPPKSA